MKILDVNGVKFGAGRPKICVPLVADSLEQLNIEISEALKSKADLLELRIDYFVKKNGLHNAFKAAEQVKKSTDMPVIFTFRTKSEGGECEITPQQYSELLVDVAKHGYADFVDIELNMGADFVQDLIGKIRKTSALVIVSNHDFSHTVSEEELICRMKTMEKIGADVAKVAMMPVCEADVVTLLSASVKMKNELSIPIITMSMGKIGAVSRLWGELSGSVVTFATVSKASAPGQMEAGKVLEALTLLD